MKLQNISKKTQSKSSGKQVITFLTNYVDCKNMHTVLPSLGFQQIYLSCCCLCGRLGFCVCALTAENLALISMRNKVMEHKIILPSPPNTQ
jgi:hypothetical protein